MLIAGKRLIRSLHLKNVDVLHKLPVLTEKHLDDLEQNINLRQHPNNIPLIRSILQQQYKKQSNLTEQLQKELNKLPNNTHPRLRDYGAIPKVLLRHEPNKLDSHQLVAEFSDICKRYNLLRMDHLGSFTGHKSYYLFGHLAELEHAIIQYVLEILKNKSFRLVSVPDVLPSEVIENCGMATDGDRTQVYKLNSSHCLSGTAEMALAGLFSKSELLEENLPMRVAAVSRCYRAETSGLQEEKGIYRVHQFTKVEMFSVCTESQSESILESFKETEIDIFKALGLNFRLLDMPPYELGTPAYQKYDIEAWMPGRKMWGEISSCSNCTDYQAKRLNIHYRTKNTNELRFAHTVNGTAAAIPRLLIALMETNTMNGLTSFKEPLAKYLNENELKKDKRLPEIKLVKFIKPDDVVN